MQSTGRGSPKADHLAPECDRAQPRIRQYRYPRGHRRGQPQIIRGGEAIYDDPHLITTRDCIDDGRLVRDRR